MADEPTNAPPEPVALDKPDVALEVAQAGTIPTEEIVKLQGAQSSDPAQVKEGTLLTGDEELKSKVTVRTRYPVDRLDVGETTVTASGTKVDGSKLPNLVKAARSAGTELERV